MFPIQVRLSAYQIYPFLNVLTRILRVTLWLVVVGSRQGHYRLVREWPWCILHFWPGCRIKIPAETWYGLDLSSTSGVLLSNIFIVDIWAFMLPFMLSLSTVCADQLIFRLSKMDMNSLQRDISWRCFRRQITVESLIMRARWWVWTRLCCAPSRFALWFLKFCQFIYWFSLSSYCADLETGREEGQISIWRDEYGKTCNTTPQAKEEGCQDGLKGCHGLTTRFGDGGERWKGQKWGISVAAQLFPFNFMLAEGRNILSRSCGRWRTQVSS